jgi:hypothetical protein
MRVVRSGLDQPPLRIGVAVDVPFGRLDVLMTRKQLHVAQTASGAMNVAGGNRISRSRAAASGMLQIDNNGTTGALAATIVNNGTSLTY